MKRRQGFSAKRLAIVAALVAFHVLPAPAIAKSPFTLQRWQGMIDTTARGPLPYVLEGYASHLGDFRAYGEVEFVAGEVEGTLEGQGAIVFETANGNLFVGVATWLHDETMGRGQVVNVSWRNSVEFSDGTVLRSTGRIVNNPPAQIVSIEYIFLATIIGLGLIVGVG